MIASGLLGAWSFDGWTILALTVGAFLYLRGARVLLRSGSSHVGPARSAAFCLGLLSIFVAVASPLDALADLHLRAHMVQHWLLMMVAPPLIWLAAPTAPMLRGLPTGWLHDGVGPVLAAPTTRRVLRAVARPSVATPLLVVTLLAWHAPALYQLALRSPFWHDVEHGCFFWAALLFWYPIIEPWPARPSPRPMVAVLHLLGFMLISGIFSATFAFSSEVFYPAYARAPRLGGESALADQQAAGAFMWLAGSLPMALAAVLRMVAWLGAPLAPANASGRTRPVVHAAGIGGRRLRALVVGRRLVQWSLFAAAAAIVVDGFFGPATPSGSNLAGVLPWNWWRPFVVLALLLAGNLFCGVCPFISTRGVAGRLFGHRQVWPRALRGRLAAALLFVLYLWSYEVFGLWDSPYWTAWVIVGYFGAAFVIEGVFPRGTFCRHVCPIGQFQFIGAAISPRSVQAADGAVCARCDTHDCVRGNAQLPGCPTGLFVPTKAGGLDCTLCLDCARACPHDNVAWLSVARGNSLGSGRALRSAPGLDLTAMTGLFVFGAFVNAAAMVSPVEALRASLADALPTPVAPLLFGLFFALALTVLPALVVFVVAWSSDRIADARLGWRAIAGRFVPSLVPLGVAMWFAHFAIHWLAGPDTLAPVLRRAWREAWTADAPSSAGPAMGAAMTAPVYSPELWILAFGLVASVVVAWRLAEATKPGRPAAPGLFWPWAVLAVGLHLAGVWILVQPMAMRGMVM